MMHDPNTTEAERIQAILDAKYCKADLEKITRECEHLTEEEQQKLLTLLQKYEHLFDGTVGQWHTAPVDIKIRDPECLLYHAKPYPVPHSQEQKLKEEVEQLYDQGILRKINHSEWACPMFTISKPDGSLRSLANLRKLNKRIRRHPYPIPKIEDMLLELEGFMFAMSLDLNMGYYHLAYTKCV